jgi:hypothetical protein
MATSRHFQWLDSHCWKEGRYNLKLILTLPGGNLHIMHKLDLTSELAQSTVDHMTRQKRSLSSRSAALAHRTTRPSRYTPYMSYRWQLPHYTTVHLTAERREAGRLHSAPHKSHI